MIFNLKFEKKRNNEQYFYTEEIKYIFILKLKRL